MTIAAAAPDASRALISALPETPHSAAANPVDVYLATLATGSRRTMLCALSEIAHTLTSDPTQDARALPWHLLRYHHAAAIRQQLAARYAATTANKMLSALRGVLKACWRCGLMSGEDYYAARSVEPVAGETLPAGREIRAGELAALMDACARDVSAAGRRDAALFALLYACGLRRAEASSLNVEDYDGETSSGSGGTGGIRLVGKRNKQRIVYVADAGARAALADWLAVRALSLPTESGPIFVAIGKGGRVQSRRLTAERVYERLQVRAAQAGVGEVSPHDFRRTFVGDLLDRGADLAVVSRMAGHANVQTTARYDRRPEEAKRRAAGLLHVPYRGVS